MNVIGPSLFSLVFVVIGALILLYGRRVAAKANASMAWPSTEGVIAHSSVSAPTTSDDSTWSTDIAYQYEVKGRPYSSSAISLAHYSSSERRARAIAARYPRAARVVVYYDPANPAEAVLERGGGTGITLLYVVGALFGGVGVFFLAMSLTGRVQT